MVEKRHWICLGFASKEAPGVADLDFPVSQNRNFLRVKSLRQSKPAIKICFSCYVFPSTDLLFFFSPITGIFLRSFDLCLIRLYLVWHIYCVCLECEFVCIYKCVLLRRVRCVTDSRILLIFLPIPWGGYL